MSFIGPMIPEHLRKNQESRDSDSDSSDSDDFGPKLPSVACMGPAPVQPPPVQQPHVQHEQKDDDSSDDDYGPSLPPHLQQKQSLDTPDQRQDEPDESDSDDEFVGPKLTEITTEVNRAAIEAEVEMRARRMRDKLDGKDEGEVKRESWMLELPEEKANRFGLGARQFSRKGVSERGGDRSAWTDSPAEKERKLREGDDEAPPDVADVAARMRDEKMEKVSKDLKSKRGAESLMDMHEKKIKKEKKAKEEKEGPAERRPFDRDIDLKANQFDEAMKKRMLKAAAKIDTRFSSGSQKFL